MFHQRPQHFVDRILVKEPLIQLGSVDLIWWLPFLVPFEQIPLFLFCFREIIIPDTLAQKFDRYRFRRRPDEIAISNGLVEVIGKGRYAIFQRKETICIAVDLILGRGSETDEQPVEIGKDGTKFLVDRAMCFVDNNQIEVTDTK